MFDTTHTTNRLKMETKTCPNQNLVPCLQILQISVDSEGYHKSQPAELAAYWIFSKCGLEDGPSGLAVVKLL